MDRDKMSNIYREPSIDASYQVSVHLAKRFQKSTNQKQEWSVAAMFVNGSGRNEPIMAITGNSCFRLVDF
jgi:hypothetical protein